MLIKIIEFIPVIAFFVSYKMTSNMIVATTFVVSACLIATALEFLIAKKISRMQVFLTCAVILFGVPTILLNDPEIIKWKVTVVNLILASAIGICLFILRKNPFSYLFGKELPLPQEAWNKLSLWWMIFFVFAAGLNVIIAFNLPALIGVSPEEAESLWVDYKTFGNGILNFVFALACGIWMFKKYPEYFSEIKSSNTKNS